MTDRDELLKMSDAELAGRCRLEFFKATGNGGQKRNKTSSAVRVSLEEYGISAEDCSERSQHRNREAALTKLRCRLAYQVRKSYEPFERESCSLEHFDYPLFLAKLLDLLFESQLDYRQAAAKCGVSATSLLKTISRDSELFSLYNRERKAAGLPAVHV